MKNIFLFALIASLFISCNSYLGKKLSRESAEDLNTEKLESICDCIEAYKIISNDMLNVVGSLDRESVKMLSENRKKALQEKLEPIKEKGREVERHCKKNFGLGDRDLRAGSNCSSYSEAVKAKKKLDEKS